MLKSLIRLGFAFMSLVTLMAVGCSTTQMGGALIDSAARAQEVCVDAGKADTRYVLAPGESLRVYGPWRTSFGIEGFQSIGDRIWQVAYVKPSNGGGYEFVPGKIVWINAETGRLQFVSPEAGVN